MNVGPDGIALVRRFEGCKLQAYPDPGTRGEPWSIGWGTTRYANGRAVQPGDTVTQAEADALLRNDLAGTERQVTRAIGGAPTTQRQFDACVSFAYNVGAQNFLSSTLLKKHRAGDFRGAAAQFLLWVHAGGRTLPGLVRRREAERELYWTGST